MCLGIPARVVSVEGMAALCASRSGLQRVDLALVGDACPGDWLLTSLGLARTRLSADEAARIDLALDALEAVGRPDFDVARFFPDLVEREPARPV
jgi:hydrogenase expression/formation protein HypC